VRSFYCYLNYDSKKDYVVDLDNVWKWIGFSRKGHAKTALEKHFVEDIDYKISLPQLRKKLDNSEEEVFPQLRKNSKGGENKEQIMITVHTFKKFCLKAGTKKADDIHEYFIKLEELLLETINEETDELRNQLQIKDSIHKKDTKLNRHNTLIEKLKKKRCVYLGEIRENSLIKIGSTDNIKQRSTEWAREFGNFILLDVFETNHFREVEDNILENTIIKKNLYKNKINGHKSIEVVQLNENFNYEQLVTIVEKSLEKNYFFQKFFLYYLKTNLRFVFCKSEFSNLIFYIFLFHKK
jgi:MSV199 domain/T5orf172 domain